MTLKTPEEILPPPTRRAAIASLFTAGYALSTVPTASAAITTDETGLTIEEVTYRAAGGHRLPAYVARPAGKGRHAAVIVVNEIFGVHAYIKDVCRRLAKLGYVAIAPDYFDRAGDPAQAKDMAAVRPIVDATPQPQVMQDTEATIRFLQKRSYVDGDRLAITGFCWGGTIVWLSAISFPQIKAGAAWYGRLSPRKPGDFGYTEGMRSPIGEAANLKAPVLGLYGEKDQGIPLTEVEAMRAALAAAGNPTKSEIVVYPGAGHAFHADYRPSYVESAAADGWARMLAWFKANGVA